MAVYRMEVLADYEPRPGRHTADVAAAVVTAMAETPPLECVRTDASRTRGTTFVSTRVTFTAPDDTTAREFAHSLPNSIRWTAVEVHGLRTGTGRNLRRI